MHSPLTINMEFHPRNGASDGYLFDLDGSERHVRPRTGIDKFPIETNNGAFAQLGSLNALVPLFYDFVWAQGYGKVAMGPIASMWPDNLNWQVTVAGLNKQLPQYQGQ